MAITRDGATPLAANTDFLSASTSTVGAAIVIPQGSPVETALNATTSLPSGYYDVKFTGQPFTTATVGSTNITINTKGIFLGSTTTSISATFNIKEPLKWVREANFFVSTEQGFMAGFANNVYFAGGGNSTVNSVFITSQDAVIWTTRNTGFGTTAVVRSFTFGNGTFVIGAGVSGLLSTSTDGITWTSRDSQMGANSIEGLTFGNNTFVAAGGGGRISSSTDGITWTSRTSEFGTTFIRTVTFGNNTFVAGGYGGFIRTSTDGTTWTTRTSEFGTTVVRAITFGNNLFVAAGNAGQIRTSTDGITWVTRTSTFGTSNIIALTFGNNLYLAGGAFGKFSISTNGTTWTQRSMGVGTSTINTMAFGNNKFIGIADGSHLMSAESFLTTPKNSVIGLIKLPEASS
jgi:photosystem II stability/assembly factor-like uncharacterized protein